MGNTDNVFNLHDAGTMQLPGGVAIVANRDAIEDLAAEKDSSALINAMLLPLAADEPLPPLSGDLRALVLEVDPLSGLSLNRLSSIRTVRPELAVVAAIGKADLDVVQKLVRLGVADVVRLPFSNQELSSRLIDVLASANAVDIKVRQATLYTIHGATGGTGSTTILTHLAKAIVDARPKAKVCLVDLDLQTSAVAQYLGIERSADVGSLLDAGSRLDGELVDGALVKTRYGFDVLCAPDSVRPLDSVDLNQILRLVELLRSEFDYVLIDLPAALTNWSLSLALVSNRVLLVSGTTIANLRLAKRKIDLLTGLGLPLARLAIIGNRLERRLFKTIGLSELEATLGCEVLGGLSNEGSELTGGQDIGRLLWDLEPRNRFLGEITKLSKHILDAESGE